MKGIVRKIEIVAADEEIRLFPVGPQGQHNRRVPPNIKISYGSDINITQLDPVKTKRDEKATSIEAHGVVGTRPKISVPIHANCATA